MITTAFRERPKWLDEEVFILALLKRFIDKLERDVKPQIRLDQKNAPQLYDFNNEDTNYLWGLVTVLANEYHILSIKRQRPKAGQEIYENALIYFNVEQEALVRHWLNRPVFDAYSLIWQKSIEKHTEKFEDGGELLLGQVIHYENKSAEDIVNGFVRLSNELSQPATLRALSARCFWGDSKFLDKREELVRALFPYYSSNILVRPLLITVYIPVGFQEVLFIENQDSFLALAEQVSTGRSLNQTALVYSAGFRGSASRVRKPKHAVFSHLVHADQVSVQRFERWWFSGESQSMPCFFWGDLDYSGMAILLALRKIFTTMQAWEPGYDAMIRYHQSGVNHNMEIAHKEKQKDPGNVYCSYADNVLLKLIRQSGKFLDQEVVDVKYLDPGIE